MDETNVLLNIVTRKLYDNKAANSVFHAKFIGQKQATEFYRNCIQANSTSIHATIRQNPHKNIFKVIKPSTTASLSKAKYASVQATIFDFQRVRT